MARRSPEALVDAPILYWARSSAGFSIEEAAARLQVKPETVRAWESEEARPSMSQLRAMATAYKRLLSDFYLPAAPDEPPMPHDLRRLPGEVALTYSRSLRHQLRLARQRRELALDFAADLEAEVPALRAHLDLIGDAEAKGAEIRRLLRIDLAMQRSWRDPRQSYNGWRAALERAGVLVFQITGVATTEVLGFSLSDRPFPVIGVNRKLAPNGRTFTLLHELVHVLLEESSICDIDEGAERPAEEQRVEVVCNAVAAATLVPRDALLSEALVAAHPARPRDWSDDELSSLARAFGVSQEVILRRLLTFGRTSRAFYAARRAAFGRLFDAPAPVDLDAEYRRNMPREVISDLGKPFTRLVLDSYANAFTSLSDVTRHLGLRAQQVAKVREMLAGE